MLSRKVHRHAWTPSLINCGMVGWYLDDMIVIQFILTLSLNGVSRNGVPHLHPSLGSFLANDIVSNSVFVTKAMTASSQHRVGEVLAKMLTEFPNDGIAERTLDDDVALLKSVIDLAETTFYGLMNFRPRG